MHKFLVFDHDIHNSRSEAQPVEARSFEAAAQEWAAQIDTGIDNAIASGAANAELDIRLEDGRHWHQFTVTGETISRYHVERKGRVK